MGLLNINVPNLPIEEIKGVELTSLGFQKYSEEIQMRKTLGEEITFGLVEFTKALKVMKKTDCYAVSEGRVSITPLSLLEKGRVDQKCWNKLSEKIFEFRKK